MYKRYIDVKAKTATYLDEIIFSVDVAEFPDDVLYYVEFEDDWWIERDPFNGQEKNEEIRLLALQIFEEFDNRDEVQSLMVNYKTLYSNYDKYYLRKKIDNLVQEAQSLMTKLNEIEEETEE